MSGNPPLTSRIKRVVVLMFENRSFDNMLGGLYPDKSQSDYMGINGIPLPKNTYVDAKTGQPVTVEAWQGAPGEDCILTVPYPDPGELFLDMCQQISGDAQTWCQPRMSGFAANYAMQKGARTDPPFSPEIHPNPRDIMQVYDPRNVSVTSKLAESYAVCDQWFASGPVQTFPNRTFLLCGTPGVWHHDLSKTKRPLVDDAQWIHLHDHRVEDTTILQLLDETTSLPAPAWKIYEHDYSIAKDTVAYVDQNDSRIVSYDSFADDVNDDRLPTFSIIEPRYARHPLGPQANSNHPGTDVALDERDGHPINVYYGEQLLLDVYTKLFNAQSQGRNKELFAETLLIVTYDEHGGLYDHVHPPSATSPYTPGQVSPGQFTYSCYGVRVPTLLINPYIAAGGIYRPTAQSGRAGVFDHTSVISTLMAQFALRNTGGPEPDSLTPRDASAPLLEGLIGPTRQASPISPKDIPLPPNNGSDCPRSG